MDHILRFAPEHHLTQKQFISHSWMYHYGILNEIHEWIMCTQTSLVMSDLYSVAFRCEVGHGDERVVGVHGNITGVPPYIGLLKCTPYLFAVVSEKQDSAAQSLECESTLSLGGRLRLNYSLFTRFTVKLASCHLTKRNGAFPLSLKHKNV